MFKKFPSTHVIFKNTIETYARFPFASLAVFTATITALILFNDMTLRKDVFLQKLFMFASLGIPVFLAVKMFAESKELTKVKAIGAELTALILLLIYYFLTPAKIDSAEKYMIQYFLFFVFALFLNAFLPFLKGKSYNGFWQYNKSLFLNFLISALYSHVMGVGLLIALAAMDHLFNLEIASQRYMQIWILTSLLFNTTIFMSKIPQNLEQLESDQSYPKGLQIFIQYILLPLVGLYLLILYAYELKIIITWNWPIGWVSNLVLWYSVVSILSLLLLYPLRNREGNRWIKVFSHWFFIFLIPLVVMLFMAIQERISQYGITEPRYLVFAMSIGLAFVVLYFIISKQKDIRTIPIVIAVLALVSAVGPWSASAVSKNSQLNRLESYLVSSNLFVDGKLVKSEANPDFDDRKEMSSIVTYLSDTHGAYSLNRFVEDTLLNKLIDSLQAAIDSTAYSDYQSKRIDEEDLCEILGFKYVSRWSQEDVGKYFHSEIADSNAISVGEFDQLIYLSPMQDSGVTYNVLGDQIAIKKDTTDAGFSFYLKEDSTESLFGTIHLADTLRALQAVKVRSEMSADDLTFILKTIPYDIKIIFYSIDGYTGEDVRINHYNALFLFKKK